jgi:hypothetical protein
VLELDAKESIFQRNFRRLELLENNMEKLCKAAEKRYDKTQVNTTGDKTSGPAVSVASTTLIQYSEVVLLCSSQMYPVFF